MLEKFGDEYLIYQQRVPMFIPVKGQWQQFVKSSSFDSDNAD